MHPMQICNDIISLTTSIRDNNFNPVISLIVSHNDDLNEKVGILNPYVWNICDNIDFKYIIHDDIRPDIHVNTSKLHLNIKGKAIFASNLKRYLSSVNWRFQMKERNLTSACFCNMCDVW